jgi:murein DD-endopeptidase MepM/ murein hydrolase activator NlpD
LLAAVGLAACTSALPPPMVRPAPAPPGLTAPEPEQAVADPATWGKLAHEVDDLVFEGGHVHFEMRWADGRVIQTARNGYVVPVTIAWSVRDLSNLDADGATEGVITLPPAPAVGAPGPTEVLATFTILDGNQPFYRYLDFKAQFGDPDAVPSRYAYAIPFVAGEEHPIIQGFGGAFSHTGSNEFAVDFDCPEGTPVVAARAGIVVAINDGVTGNGTTPEWTDYAHTNFVLVLHDDGTIGQYMHLAPDGVEATPGQRVTRGEIIARSGNTGYSTTPHLHFQVMTSAIDGLGAISFPFDLQVAPRIHEEPVEGKRYLAFEQ